MNISIFWILLAFNNLAYCLDPEDVIICIKGQRNKYDNEFSKILSADIRNQSARLYTKKLVNVYLLHEIVSHDAGHWTFLHALPFIMSMDIIKPSTKWIILCEDQSTIDLSILIGGLSKEDHNKEQYFGYPIYDQDATIIHHFAFFENPLWFQYPLLSSGVAFTLPLIERLAERVQKVKPKTEFSIDASHELALFILQNIIVGRHTSLILATPPTKLQGEPEGFEYPKQKSSTGTNDPWTRKEGNIYSEQGETYGKQIPESNSDTFLMVSKSSSFCSPRDISKQCGIRPRPNKTHLKCNTTDSENIYFAIKTCKKFHKDRIPIIEMTWGSYAVHKTYYSDLADKDIPTVDTGVRNTETGHCSKTISILKLALNAIEHPFPRPLHGIRHAPIEWIMLVDDDTLLSVAGVSEILGCYNSSDDIYLGERYGYRLYAKDGFNYITGGGGIVFSLPTAKKIVEHCTCPTSSSPDDMILGSCLHRLGIEPIHSSRFHQARPPDYHKLLLSVQSPISFHKFWQLDPITEYEKWFKAADRKITQKRKINNIDFGKNALIFDNASLLESHIRKNGYDIKLSPINSLSSTSSHLDL